jgi:hypothetical protein
MKRFSKKTWIIFAMLAVAAVATIGAYAYWTTGGTGSGSATTGTSSAVDATQTSTVSAMSPGSPAQALDFSLDNTASTNQFVTSVVISISGVTGANIDATHPCTASDFTLVQPTATYGDLTPGVHSYSPSGASIAMINSASNQDGCKSASVALTYTVS